MSRRGGREGILLYLTIAGSMERAVEGTVSRALEINWQVGGVGRFTIIVARHLDNCGMCLVIDGGSGWMLLS